jgi:ATP-dependent RNA helicase DDX27
MAVNDFIMTMDSDEEQPLTSFKESKSRKSQNVDPEDAQLNADFTFDLAGDPYADILGEQNLRDLVKKGSRPVRLCLRRGI